MRAKLASARTPDVSVVIPTMRRETRLAFALEALASQTLPRDRFEVVVVRADEPGPKATAPDGLDVRFLTAHARARAPRPAATSAGAPRRRRWSRSPTTTAGPRPTGSSASRRRRTRTATASCRGGPSPTRTSCERLHGLSADAGDRRPEPWYQTCNIAYPRALLERLDGFDERFDGGEDADLGLRAVEAGAERSYVGEARVWHAVHSRTSGRRCATTRAGTRSRS